MSTQNTVTVLESRGVIEARKLKPKIESAKRLMLDTAIEIGARYRELGDDDKADFRSELGLSVNNAQRYVLISERYLTRVKQLPPSPGEGALEKTFSFAARVSQLSEETFREIVKAGSVTLASTSKDVARAATVASPIKQKIVTATSAINRAARCINAVRALMDKEHVTILRGPEIRQLREEFQLLCAELMAADPDMVEQARKVLKGAA